MITKGKGGGGRSERSEVSSEKRGGVRSGWWGGRGVVRQAHQGRWVRWDRSGRWGAAGSLHSTSSGQAPSAGSGQVLRGRRDVVRLGPPKTAGRLTMNGRGWGTEVGRRGLGAAWDVFSRSGFGGNVFSFFKCVHFPADVFTLAGQVFSFRWRALVGDRGRRDEGDVSTLSGQCVQFLARCVNFSAECVHFGGRCVQFLAGRSGWGWGADGRRDSSFGFGKLSGQASTGSGQVLRGRRDDGGGGT